MDMINTSSFGKQVHISMSRSCTQDQISPSHLQGLQSARVAIGDKAGGPADSVMTVLFSRLLNVVPPLLARARELDDVEPGKDHIPPSPPVSC